MQILEPVSESRNLAKKLVRLILLNAKTISFQIRTSYNSHVNKNHDGFYEDFQGQNV